MQAAPYNTPPVLARMPLMALFWTMIAPFLFPIMILSVATLIFPGGTRAIFESETTSALQDQWLIYVISNMLFFMALSLWAERARAGPFAGAMRADLYWLVLAAMLGPVIFIGAGELVDTLFSGGDPNWMYRGEEAPALLGVKGFGLMMVLYAIVLAPLVEEVAFRGVALGCLLARGWTPLPAALLTSAAFASLHFQYAWPALLPVFVFGLFLAWLRIRSGSVVAPILAHMAANGVSLLFFWLSLSTPT